MHLGDISTQQSAHTALPKNPFESRCSADPTRHAALLLMCAAFGSVGCDDDKPYTPFQVASSLPNEPSVPKDREQTEEKTERAAEVLRAPAGSKRWKAFERTLVAPQGTHFEVALTGLNSEPNAIFAWVLPSKPNSSRQEAGLWVFDETGRAQSRLAPVPEFLPSGSDCRLEADLKPTGRQTFSSWIGVRCDSDLLAGTPIQSVAVLDPAKEDPFVVHLRHRQPAAGEKLEFSIDSSDRDEDGLDDVEITVSLTDPTGTKESLPLRWLVRTAGASRQPEAPRTEFDKRASRLLIAAVRKAEREAATAQVVALRRLLSAICGELGSPTIVGGSGEKLSCGNLDGSLGRLVEAEVKAFLGMGEPARALGAAERAPWFGKNVSRSESLGKLLKEKISFVPAKRIARFRVAPKTSTLPYRTPLTFDESGQLWLVTDDKTKRLTMEGDPPLVTPATEEEPEKRIEPPTWSIEIPGPGGKTLQAAIPSCERSEVLLAFQEQDARLSAPIPLPLLAPRPGKCAGFAPGPLPITPHEWKAGALTFALAGEVMDSQGRPALPRTPFAWETSYGLAVAHEGKLSVWTGTDAKGLHHCTYEPKRDRVACLAPGSIDVLELAKPDGD